MAVTSIVVAALIIIMLVVVDPVLALLAFLAIGSIYGIVYASVRRRLNTLGRRQIESNRLRYKRVSEAFGGIKDVQVLGREEYFLKDFVPASIENAKIRVTRAMIGEIPRYVLEIIAFGGVLMVVLYMMRVMGNFRNAVPTIGLYAFAAYRMIPTLQKIFADLAKLRTNLPVVQLIHDNMGDWEAEEARIKAKKKQTKLALDSRIA